MNDHKILIEAMLDALNIIAIVILFPLFMYGGTKLIKDSKKELDGKQRRG